MLLGMCLRLANYSDHTFIYFRDFMNVHFLCTTTFAINVRYKMYLRSVQAVHFYQQAHKHRNGNRKIERKRDIGRKNVNRSKRERESLPRIYVYGCVARGSLFVDAVVTMNEKHHKNRRFSRCKSCTVMRMDISKY